MRKINFGLSLFIFGALLAPDVFAQADTLSGPPYQNPRTAAVYLSRPLYLGGEFVHYREDSVRVWLDTNYAGWTGTLFYYDPKTGQYDSLFTNKTPNRGCVPKDAPCAASINLSARHDIGIGDTVHFMYRVNPGFGNPVDQLPSWTGPNNNPASLYYSQRVMANPPAPWPHYGRRHSLAGRVNDLVVEFGFEDEGGTGPNGAVSALTGDYDFTDIVFRVSGLFISLENEVAASLVFTDKTGKSLLPGAFWSPSNDTVYLKYNDDYVKGDIAKDITLKMINRKGAAAPDSEMFTVLPSGHNGVDGVWTLKIPLKENPGGIPGDKILEAYFLGQLTATVKSHDRKGLPDGNTLSAQLNIAYPDQPEKITIHDCTDTLAAINRATGCVTLTVTNQTFTHLPVDTIYSEVHCDGSGDAIALVTMIKQPDGTYKSGSIVKNEGSANPADAILSCQSADNIKATYVDEIYGGRAQTQAAWTVDGATAFYYTPTGNSAQHITTIKDGAAASFTAVLTAPTPRIGVRDTVPVTFTTPQGESEIFNAVETGPNSAIFTVDIPYGFLLTPPVRDGKITGYLDPTQVVAFVTVHGEATIGSTKLSADIVLTPALNLVKYAYIKDLNGDGGGDHVYLVFSRPIEALPASLSPVYWNQVAPDFQNKLPPVLTLSPTNPNVLIADFSASEFKVGLTGIPAGQAPFATLPADPVFAGQKPAIADSIGPILQYGKLASFNSLTVKKSQGEALGIDTLTVVISEGLQAKNDWDKLIRFSKPVNGECTDYAHSILIPVEGIPIEGLGHDTFTFNISGGKGPTPLVGDCIYIYTDGSYRDLAGNLPPIHGIILDGTPPPPKIEAFQGYPPVVGLSPDNPGFVVMNNDPHTDAQFSTLNLSGAGGGTFVTVWVPPWDFPKTYIPGTTIYTAAIPSTIDAPSQESDPAVQGSMPLNISTVQVISTSEYIADVNIFDNLGNFVRHFKQAFGYHGEMLNGQRAASHGLASYLLWDLKDHRGQRAGQGVYVWKVVFAFKNNKQEIRYTRTGLSRNLAWLPGK